MGNLTIKPASGGLLKLQDAGETDRVQITDNGTTVLYGADGNSAITIGTDNTAHSYLSLNFGSYHGDAGGAGSGSLTGNTIDDYEEGTWTPEFRGSGGNDTGASTTVFGATYTRIGNIVTLRCDIRWAAIGNWTTYARVYGMPFAQSGTTRSIGLCGAVKKIELDTSYTFFASIGDGLAYIELLKQASDQGSTVRVDVGQFDDALNNLAINVTYQV